jgi:hypothetical protein
MLVGFLAQSILPAGNANGSSYALRKLDVIISIKK